MRTPLSALAALLLLPAHSPAQTAADLNEGSRVVQQSDGTHTLSWWGRFNRVYLPEGSENLVDWVALPAVELGQEAAISYGLATNASRYFLRLRHSDDPDFDHDGLSNLEEYLLGTNLASADSDGDGLPDGWERAHGLDPKNASDAATFPPAGSQTYLTLFLAEKGMLNRCAAATMPTGMQVVLRTPSAGFKGVKSTGEIATVAAP